MVRIGKKAWAYQATVFHVEENKIYPSFKLKYYAMGCCSEKATFHPEKLPRQKSRIVKIVKERPPSVLKSLCIFCPIFNSHISLIFRLGMSTGKQDI